MKKDKALCIGCSEDYYNHDDHSTTKECWCFKTAEVKARYCIGWWTPMDKKENFTKVTTLNCHTETGRELYLEELPEHLR